MASKARRNLAVNKMTTNLRSFAPDVVPVPAAVVAVVKWAVLATISVRAVESRKT
ncbi:hypothetical protein ANO14919_141950 [Xylariales sp. No.14919]|nr:hypothetical protein ANO14919_141950 [Xylariales sp. No.14919]